MTLSNIPYDLLTHITTFLNDKTNTLFMRICKYLYEYSTKFGYLTYIKATSSSNMMTFIQRFIKHSLSIKTVEIRSIDDPHLWIPHYVEKLIFEHCSIPSYLNPKKQVFVTKYFKLIDYNRYKYKTTLRVNWECFPNLEELELYVHDVNWTFLDHCKKLKRVIINTNVKDIYKF